MTPRTPADRIHTRLRAREAARATRDEAIRAAHAAYAVAYPLEVEALLDDAAELAGLDERPPEPVKAPRKKRAPKVVPATPLPAERVTELLALRVPDFAEAIHGFTLDALKQLRTAASSRKLVAYVVTIDGEIGGRS